MEGHLVFFKANIQVPIDQADLAQFDKENKWADAGKAARFTKSVTVLQIFFTPSLHQQKKKLADKL